MSDIRCDECNKPFSIFEMGLYKEVEENTFDLETATGIKCPHCGWVDVEEEFIPDEEAFGYSWYD